MHHVVGRYLLHSQAILQERLSLGPRVLLSDRPEGCVQLRGVIRKLWFLCWPGLPGTR